MSIWGSPVLLGGGSGGGGGDYYWRVRLWDYSGIAVQAEVYVLDGSGLPTQYGTDWATAPGGEFVPASWLESIHQNLDLYGNGVTLIPYSTAVVCEATVDTFSPDSLTWGRGRNPVQFSQLGAVFNAQDNSVLIPVKSAGVLAYVNLEASNRPFTAYIVAKLNDAAAFSRILSSMASHSGGQGMLLYGRTINVSSWANDTSTGLSADTYFAGALKYNGSADSGGIVNESSYITKPPSASSSVLTIARTDITAATANAEPCDIQVKYLGVTFSADDETAMRGNLANLIHVFGIIV